MISKLKALGVYYGRSPNLMRTICCNLSALYNFAPLIPHAQYAALCPNIRSYLESVNFLSLGVNPDGPFNKKLVIYRMDNTKRMLSRQTTVQLSLVKIACLWYSQRSLFSTWEWVVAFSPPTIHLRTNVERRNRNWRAKEIYNWPSRHLWHPV